MSSDTEFLQQPNTIQQLRSFKPRRPLKLLAVALFIVLVAGTGGYLLEIRTSQRAPQSTQRVSFLPSPAFIAQFSVSAPSSNSQQTMVTKNWKTYTNEELGISFNYPNDWKVSEEKQSGNVILGPSTAPCPSDVNPFICQTAQEIFITIENNKNDKSLFDYLNQKFDQFKPMYASITINGIEGLKTGDISERFDEENVFVKNRTNIYRIAWIKSPATKQITKEVFNKILSTLKFAY